MSGVKHTPGGAASRFEAWERNAVSFIRSKGLETEFSDWCGGWPVPPEAQSSDVGAALSDYDAMLASCPLNSRSSVVQGASQKVCKACGADASGSCGRNNPWPVIDAVRKAITRATGDRPEKGGAL